jgi:hypothetical protein
VVRHRAACLGLVVVALILGGGTRTGHATVYCPVTLDGPSSPRLATLDARDRLAFIDSRLTQVGKLARIWTLGWGGGIAVSGLASLAVVPFVQHGDRVDWYTSAASAAVGVIPFVVAPLAVTRDARELHAKVLANADAGADVCRLLADAESRLIHDAADQRSQQRWYVHAGNVAFNTGVTLFLGLGFHHWTSGLINGLSGVAVGEAIILTQPVGTIKDLDLYRAASFPGGLTRTF